MAINPRNVTMPEAANVFWSEERIAAVHNAIKEGRISDAEAVLAEEPKPAQNILDEFLTTAVRYKRWQFAITLVDDDSGIDGYHLGQAVDDDKPQFVKAYLDTSPGHFEADANGLYHIDRGLIKYARDIGRHRIEEMFIDYLDELWGPFGSHRKGVARAS